MAFSSRFGGVWVWLAVVSTMCLGFLVPTTTPTQRTVARRAREHDWFWNEEVKQGLEKELGRPLTAEDMDGLEAELDGAGMLKWLRWFDGELDATHNDHQADTLEELKALVPKEIHADVDFYKDVIAPNLDEVERTLRRIKKEQGIQVDDDLLMDDED